MRELFSSETVVKPPLLRPLDSSPNIPLSAQQAAIVRDCADAVRTATRDCSAPRVLFFDTCVVKFNEESILNEGDTQTFVYEGLKSFPNAPSVPEVYDCFSCNRMQYLVMERVEFPTVETWINSAIGKVEAETRFDMACQAVAAALRCLFALSPPVGADIGLIEGAYARTQNEDLRATSGRAYHPFFGNSHAPFRYTDAPALQRHIIKVQLNTSASSSQSMTDLTKGSQSSSPSCPAVSDRYGGRAAGDDPW